LYVVLHITTLKLQFQIFVMLHKLRKIKKSMLRSRIYLVLLLRSFKTVKRVERTKKFCRAWKLLWEIERESSNKMSSSFYCIKCRKKVSNSCLSWWWWRSVQDWSMTSEETSSASSLTLLSYTQFHQHFTSSFCADIVLTKNYKAKLYLEKSCAKHFHIKKAPVKCSWNWHL